MKMPHVFIIASFCAPHSLHFENSKLTTEVRLSLTAAVEGAGCRRRHPGEQSKMAAGGRALAGPLDTKLQPGVDPFL